MRNRLNDVTVDGRPISLDLATRDKEYAKRLIRALIQFIRDADKAEILQLTRLLGEEDINFPLLVSVEKAIRMRECELNEKLPSLVSEEMVVASKSVWHGGTRPSRTYINQLRHKVLPSLLVLRQSQEMHNQMLFQSYVSSARSSVDIDSNDLETFKSCKVDEATIDRTISHWRENRPVM